MAYCMNRIKHFRELANMTQQELADRLGTSVRNVRRWENEESSPDVIMGMKIAMIFGQNVEEIFKIE